MRRTTGYSKKSVAGLLHGKFQYLERHLKGLAQRRYRQKFRIGVEIQPARKVVGSHQSLG